jgi:hypothetical protein
MKITPTQFKELLLEEVKDCTEPGHVIFSIVRDMDPNDVSELFQDVFEMLPGVDMTRPEKSEEEPIPTDYVPGGENGDRPVIGFKEQLIKMIREVVAEEAEPQIGDSLKGTIAKYNGEMGAEVGGIRIITFPSKKEAMQAYSIMYETAQTMGLRFTIPEDQPVDGKYQLKLARA